MAERSLANGLRVLYRWEAGRPRGGIVQNESILFFGDIRLGRIYRRTDVADHQEPWEWTCHLITNTAGQMEPVCVATEEIARAMLLKEAAKIVCKLFDDVQPRVKLEEQDASVER